MDLSSSNTQGCVHPWYIPGVEGLRSCLLKTIEDHTFQNRETVQDKKIKNFWDFLIAMVSHTSPRPMLTHQSPFPLPPTAYLTEWQISSTWQSGVSRKNHCTISIWRTLCCLSLLASSNNRSGPSKTVLFEVVRSLVKHDSHKFSRGVLPTGVSV